MENAKRYEAAGVLEKNSWMILSRLLKPTPDEATELSRLHADLETLMKENISNFILNGVTDAAFDKFLSDADNIGINRYLEIYQKYYNDYVASVR
jgi:putative aldouronate transport system substrate-binding protein